MKPSLDKNEVISASFPQVAVPDYSFYEYHWDGPRRPSFPVWQPRQTTLVVVFDGGSRHLFSSARILLYYNTASLKDSRSIVWDIQPLGSMVQSFRGQAEHALPNAPTLPKLTIAFEVVVGQFSVSRPPFGVLVLRSPPSIQELRRDSINVLLECELLLTSETLSLSLSFAHSTLLRTPIMPVRPDRHTVPTSPVSQIELITTRIVRVLPPAFVRPKITHGCLPTELLIKTFEDAEFRNSWHDDLLSFAQVCRAWSCAMNVLHSRLSFSDDDTWYHSRHLLDAYALAKALSKVPDLGQAFHHLTTNNLGESESWQDVFGVPPRKNPSCFTTALIAILRTTKNLHYLHLGQLDPYQTDALFTVLHALGALRMLSIGPVEERSSIVGLIQPHRTARPTTCLLSTAQLARCMARWPALTSLQVHHLHPGTLCMWRLTLRPPACALTHLAIARSRMSDRDLVYLFASSAKTLERVVLDKIEGVTNAGLIAFLLGVAENVVYLTVRDVALPPFRQWGNLVIGRRERALDAMLDKMPRLRELRISGDVASEFMLDRRSKMFVAHDTLEETRVPVVRLWLEDVPRLCGFAADGKWPGWCTPGKGLRR